MTYVEWLRVRNVLRVVAIVLGLLIVVSLVLRISFARYLNDDASFISHIQMQPGAKVSKLVLPDGTPRTIIDDPAERTHVTIDNLGYGGRHIVITEPKTGKHAHDNVSIGSVRVIESEHGGMQTTIVDTNGAVPFLFYMFVADIMALVIATILGAPFARENDGHLESALTRPASRTELALRTVGVDAVGILVGSAMTIVAFVICQAMFEVPHFDFSGINLQAIVIGILLPLAWYAMLAAASASMKRGYGAVIGFAWPVAILALVFASIPWGDSMLGSAVHNIFWVISRADPLTYVQFTSQPGTASTQPISEVAPNFGPRILMESILFVIYGALALVQWQRVEA